MSPSESSSGSRVPYRKLPGDFRGLVRRYSLWLGSDHLLLVDSSRFSETYKRFYLRDIQTVMVRKTPRYLIPYYWFLLAGTALITLLAGLTPYRIWLFWPSVAILAGVAVYLYLASTFQSCACHLITRVNKVELPSLFRLHSAQRFVEIMAPQITAAQGPLPVDWVDRSTTLEELSTAADPNLGIPIELLSAGQFSWVTVMVFVLVLVDGALTFQQLRTNDATILSTLNTFNMIALAICATISIVRLTRQHGGRVLRTLVLAGLFVVASVTYGSTLLQSIDQQIYHQTFKNMMQYFGMRPLAIVELLADVGVAIPGLVLAFRQKKGAR